MDGKDYNKDLIVFPDHVSENWRRDKDHQLKPKDIEEVLAFEPDVLVIGRGSFGRVKITDEVKKALMEKNIDLIAERTGAAKDVFNRLTGEGKKAVAALHLTC